MDSLVQSRLVNWSSWINFASLVAQAGSIALSVDILHIYSFLFDFIYSNIFY